MRGEVEWVELLAKRLEPLDALRLFLRSGLELVQPLGGFDYQPRRHAGAEADATDLGWLFQLGPVVECSAGEGNVADRSRNRLAVLALEFVGQPLFEAGFRSSRRLVLDQGQQALG
ncbi:hypothetical protein CDC08_16615 [Pseudomonas aeruginosa]|nr:hypothetical protein CDC08_16615 [Pseudomonas aeruginosa]